MQRPKIFQTVLIAVFVVLMFLAFLGFSGKLPLPTKGDKVNYGTVTFWGTIPSSVIQPVIAEKLGGDKSITITYVQKNKATFERDFVEALATGTGPDIFLLGHDEMLKSLNKIAPISYQSVTERDFKSLFIEGGEIFLRPEGIVALPFTVDPIVMYWNRDILTNASVVLPPTKWGEFYTLAPKITVRDRAGNISQSLVALGEYDNITHAKEILSILMLQTGRSVVKMANIGLIADISTEGNETNPVAQAVSFYNEFSNTGKDSYSWNRALPSSRNMFEAGDLAFYFGYASEYPEIKKKNPHLNFDVAVVPQVETIIKKTTFGYMQGIAVVKSTKNPMGSLRAALLLSNSEFVSAVTLKSGLPPVRRDLLVKRPTDAVFSVFYDSALIARAWPDPSPKETDELFRDMINDVNSGRLKISQALSVLHGSVGRLLSK